MTIYILTWNPDLFDYNDIDNEIKMIKETGSCKSNWSCGRTKKIKIGDKFIFLRQGRNPKGIFGSGKIISEPWNDKHWENESKIRCYIDIEFDLLVNPDKNQILETKILKEHFHKYHWRPFSSGTKLPDNIAQEVLKKWVEFNSNPKLDENINDIFDERIIEGEMKQITLTKYERDPVARKLCLEKYGYTCKVCGFNFEKFYGNIGKKFIHVHHLKPLNIEKQSHEINPIDDLRPVCPNCHAMIHRNSKKILSIKELKRTIKTKK
jgi:5-methylcytosine-specific restriction protein A